MPQVISASTHTPTEAIASFILDARGNVVPISDDPRHPTAVSAGRYQLHWDMRANPGATGTVQLLNLVAGSWHPINPPLPLKMGPGRTRMASDDVPAPPVAPYFFNV